MFGTVIDVFYLQEGSCLCTGAQFWNQKPQIKTFQQPAPPKADVLWLHSTITKRHNHKLTLPLMIIVVDSFMLRRLSEPFPSDGYGKCQ